MAFVFVFFILRPGIADASPSRAIASAQIDRASLNVAAGETVTLTVHFARPGTASVALLDRDGYCVRTLASKQRVGEKASFVWNGRDDAGLLAADEAYSFRVEWRGKKETAVYSPGESMAHVSPIEVRSYDRRTGTLVYMLPAASRVHVQAGTALVDPKTKKLVGPVMKTIVNREPRVAGTVAEHWNGYDESGAIFIPDLENFVVAIAASPLPENAVVTYGNRQRRFTDTLASRLGRSFFKAREHHQHHGGLRTEDDLSPTLKIEPLNAVWSRDDRAWILTEGNSLRARISVEGPTSSAFRRHPATLELFLDGRRIDEPQAKRGDTIEIALDPMRERQVVSINWNSEWGPVAANTIQVHR